MTDFRTKLSHRFRKQQEFANGYSPLYARLFGIVGDWIEAGEGHPFDGDSLVDWLVNVGNGRAPLDITLLLMAGLHRDILNRGTETAELAQYYPSTGGKRSVIDPHLPQILRQTIMARREQLAPFIQSATVQTNETARGVCWLLPLLYTGWEAVHLVDLGASAGLNLVAEVRNYRLVFGEQYVDFGSGQPVQFLMQSHGNFYQPPAANHQPSILSRTGCDLAPFKLETAVDEQTLSAFIWGDQPQRLERLREGIASFRRANLSDSPVRLYPTRLPDDLPQFLSQHIPAEPNHPVVIYNTFMTAYLDDKGTSMQQHIADWVATQNRPVLWLQWEPLWNERPSPSADLIAWTADLWQANSHRHWHLAWNHPHGIEVAWQADFRHWIDYWRQES